MEDDGSLSLKRDKSCPQELGTGTSACTLARRRDRPSKAFLLDHLFIVLCKAQGVTITSHFWLLS